MSRTLVIGDIHGGAKALVQVLERASVTHKDKIIQLGDVSDGWSETSECVDILLAQPNLVSLRGNHDCWTYDWIMKGKSQYIWTQQGGQATIDSYIKSGKMQDRFHIDFWRNQKDYYIDDQNRLFIHAGWEFSEGFPEGAEMSFGSDVGGTLAKECHWDRNLLNTAKDAHYMRAKDPNAFKQFTALDQFKEVYIGHTVTKDSKPKNYLNLWNLDTGCGWHGKLTIMDIDTKEYWQSDPVTLLYPNEKGRG